MVAAFRHMHTDTLQLQIGTVVFFLGLIKVILCTQNNNYKEKSIIPSTLKLHVLPGFLR